MDDNKTANNGSDADDKTAANTPLTLVVLKEKAPEDTHTTKSEKHQESPQGNPSVPPEGSHPNLFGAVWMWVRRDTSSTDWLIVLLTTVIAGTSYLQWREIHAGSTDTHTLAQAADTQAKKMGDMSDAAQKIKEAAQGMVLQEQRIADNAQKATDASNGQSESVVRENITASHLEQRAWVAMIGMAMDAPEVGKPLHGFIQWSNSGKTFAKKVKPLCHFIFMPNIADQEKILMDLGSKSVVGRTSIGVLAPNAQYKTPIETQQAVDETDKARISGTWYTYMWGELTYYDIFSHQHITTYCSFRQGATAEFEQCPFHNNAD